jgi:DNA helicase-2/ATP-dependent DNA helicase PcrA
MSSNLFTPQQIATILGQHPPTDEQVAIITSDHTRPAVVIAGAGSGKTETMSTRLIYLIANGLVQPDRVLGLTFTRKSANDLAIKVRKSLKILEKSAEFQEAARDGNLPSLSAAGEPTISTYHSYAHRVAKENALRLGVEPPEQPLGEAAAWQQVERIVREYDGDMSEVSDALSTVVDNVMRLVSQLQENDVNPDLLLDEALKFTEKISNKTPYRNSDKLALTRDSEIVQYARAQLIPIIKEVMEYRNKRSQFTFDDQMALAAKVATTFPEVGEIERAKFHLVLLDEYQDTSSSQLRLMQGLFGGGHPITAVGDPHQAIYAWRGASSDTIGAFQLDFPDYDGAPAKLFTLSKSWRNDISILNLANEIAAPLRTRSFDTPILTAKPSAVTGILSGGIYISSRDEAEGIADAIAPYWEREARSKIPELKAAAKNDSSLRYVESTAILVRKKKQIAEIEMALRAKGLPVEVVGIDGLIHVPEVAEIRAALTVITNPEAGSSLVKLMSGGFWQIGIRDMSALAKVGKNRGFVASGGQRISLVDRVMAGGSGEEDELARSSIIETLNEIDDFTGEEKALFSAEGLTRLTSLAKVLRKLRTLIHLPIPDLIYQVERELALGVDVELTAHQRRYIDKFLDEAANFYAQGGSLRSFLAWLTVAESEERGLRAGGVEVRKDVVQILTVHSAKGGEWDLVVVPGLAKGNFPSDQSGENWLKSKSVLPFALRADSSRLPKFDLRNETSAQEVANKVKEFANFCNARKADEERRLAYVAVTRARYHLIATTSWWRDATEPHEASDYFLTIAQHIDANEGKFYGSLDDKPASNAENPKLNDVRREVWPRDPLGEIRERFNQVAEEIKRLSKSEAEGELKSALDNVRELASFFENAQLVIREISQRRVGERVYLPAHLSVSGLMAFAESSEEFVARLRRPLPFKPDPIARRGTAFHTWLEERFALSIPLIGDDELPGAADEGALDDSALEKLKEKWLRSEWAARNPYRVEVPFDRSVGGIILRGRMDAVYKNPDGTFDVVDWKTGSAKSGEELVNAAIQLAVYRLAFAEIEGVPLTLVRAAFHYVSSEETVRPSDLLDYEGLLALIHRVPLASEISTPNGR